MNYEIKKLNPFGVIITPKTENMSIKDIDVESLKRLFQDEQLLVLRDFKTFDNSDDFSTYCERFGKICLWPFGKVLKLIQQENPEDHIFDHSYVPMHWDGMYRPEVPEYQIFHCLIAPKEIDGGRTTFSNTVLSLKNTSPRDKALWEKVTGIYKRKMEFYNSKTVSPIITRHPYRDYSVIRYNEPHSADKGHFINPVDMEFIGLDECELAEFHQGIRDMLYTPENFYAHSWKEKDVVIADNFSLLHGREAFTSGVPRHIERVQVLSHFSFNNPGLESYE